MIDFREDHVLHGSEQQASEGDLQQIETDRNEKYFQCILQFDRMEIKTMLTRFSISISDVQTTERLRLILKKVLLEEIMKHSQELTFYEKCYK